MAKFCDSPYFIVEDFIQNIDPYGTAYPKRAHLRGPSSGMVAKLGYGVDLFIKTEAGYLRIKGVPVDDTPTDNVFKFFGPYDNYRTSDVTWTDLLNTYAGSEVYFRKDCQFHDFVNNNSDWKNFVNTNKVYLYFGKIFPDTSENFFNVIFYGMKDYVVDALPENNRTDRFTEFLQVSFDQQYQEIYNRLKNILTLSDPKETDSDYLYYIGNMFNMTIPNLLGDIPSQRAWVENLPYLLKRVGTYTALNIIWRAIVGGTSNFLNIYERWHPVIDPEDVPYLYFEDYLYTANPIYGGTVAVGPAGEGYYHSLETTGAGGYPTDYSWPDGKILSPHYKVQIDLSGEPLGADYIINKNIMDNLLEYWKKSAQLQEYHIINN